MRPCGDLSCLGVSREKSSDQTLYVVYLEFRATQLLMNARHFEPCHLWSQLSVSTSRHRCCRRPTQRSPGGRAGAARTRLLSVLGWTRIMP